MPEKLLDLTLTLERRTLELWLLIQRNQISLKKKRKGSKIRKQNNQQLFKKNNKAEDKNSEGSQKSKNRFTKTKELRIAKGKKKCQISVLILLLESEL